MKYFSGLKYFYTFLTEAMTPAVSMRKLKPVMTEYVRGVLLCDGHHPRESDDHGEDTSTSHDDWHQQEVYRYYFQHVDPIEPH